MFCSLSKSLLSLGVLIYVTQVTVLAAEAPKQPCRTKFCTDQENVVWATDERNCYVFRNKCFYQNAQCQRNTPTDLKEVSKSTCQQYCRTICPFNYEPVCAEYNGRLRTFGNRCGLINYVCASGETYREVPLTNCVEGSRPATQ